ncbi:MAG TPA: nuclear transport factor 2 family protein [Rugosimonospora sp.]|nr:nuclear transport factor 2 family protein [Rugosimonospora sp.]
MALTHKEIFERHVYASAISRDPDEYAAIFTEDGVFEAPLLPPGHPLPRRMVGRAAIRAGSGVYLGVPAYQGTVNFEQSAYALHETADPDVFIAEIDTVFEEANGQRTTMSLVKIFRIRDGQIASLRDYFTPPPSVVTDLP